jgi:hypothetical protein
MGSTKWFRHTRKMRRVAVSYPSTETTVPPYIYGAWLGDGHSDGITFTNQEPEIWEEIDSWTTKAGLTQSDNVTAKGAAETRRFVMNKGHGSTKPGANSLRQWFLEAPKSAGIRREFMINSREARLELVAGLLDTDGEVAGGKNLGLVTKHLRLAEDFATVCRSLGFGAEVKESWKAATKGGEKKLYFRVGLRGAVDQIPLRVPRKRCKRSNKFNALTPGFKVEPVGEGDYFGFALEDPEGLFLLADCTVVHNSTILRNILRAYPGVHTVVLAPGTSLLKQTVTEMREHLPEREVKLMGGGSTVRFQSDDITVCSMDSVHLLDPGPVRLVVVDEPHAIVSEGRADHLPKFAYARKYAVGATLKGRYDGRDFLLEGLFGPVLANRTYREAVVEKAICPIKVVMVRKVLPRELGDRTKMMKKHVMESEWMARLCRRLSHELIPQDAQTLFFIKQEKQAELYQKYVGMDVPIVMDKILTAKQRDELTKLVEQDHLRRLFCSDIFVQGVTFHEVRFLVNCSGGGANTGTIQKPGRLAEIRPDKACGVMVDVFFDVAKRTPGSPPAPKSGLSGVTALNRESKDRLEAYREIGYEVDIIDEEHLAGWFDDKGRGAHKNALLDRVLGDFNDEK